MNIFSYVDPHATCTADTGCSCTDNVIQGMNVFSDTIVSPLVLIWTTTSVFALRIAFELPNDGQLNSATLSRSAVSSPGAFSVSCFDTGQPVSRTQSGQLKRNQNVKIAYDVSVVRFVAYKLLSSNSLSPMIGGVKNKNRARVVNVLTMKNPQYDEMAVRESEVGYDNDRVHKILVLMSDGTVHVLHY